MAIYKVSPAAQQDLVEIYIRCFREWGASKAETFQIQLIASFQLLTENPDIGRDVSIRPQLQRHELSPYVIFYRKFSYGIRIARIFYKNRAMEKYL